MSGQLNSPWLSTSDLLAPVNALYQHQLEDAQSQSLLGDLAVKQQTLGLEYAKLAQQKAAGAALLGGNTNTPTDGSSPPADGSTSSGGGGGSFLDNLASIESGDQNIVSKVDTDSKGLTLAQGGNPAEISQGHFQINTPTWHDFAGQAGVDVNQYPTAMSAPRDVQARVASVIPFSRFGPRTQTLMRSRFGPLDTSQTVGTLAGTPALTFNPNTAGPRVGGTATASVGPNDGALPVPPIPPPAGDPAPANMAAVKQAATGLLAMPEADAATAYPGVVQELQSRGFAMNAPPTYPGRARLQAMVNGGTAPPFNPNAGPRVPGAPPAGAPEPVAPPPLQTGQAPPQPAVGPDRLALRLGGTNTAGPAAGPGLPDVSAPNQLYQTGLPGITISGPASALAPPGTTPASLAAPATTAATTPPTAPAGGTPASPGGTGRPPVPIPPTAPSRMIQTEPTYQSGPMMGLTASQGREAAAMVAGGTPVTDVAAKMESWRQQNITNRQTAATANVAQQQLDATRQQQYYENQVKAGWETLPNGATYNRFTGETKYPPSPRFGPQVVGPDGKPAIPVEGGAGGTQYLPVPAVPAGASYQVAVKDLDEDRGKINEIAADGRAAQTDNIRVQEMRNILANADNDTGPGTDTKAALTAYIQRWAPAALTDWTRSSADLTGPAAIEMFQKLGFMGATAQEQTSSPRGGYQATKLFQQFNPGAQLLTSTNNGLLAQRLITNQANIDYSQGAQDFYTKQTDRLKSPEHDYDNLAHFDQQWQQQRNPQVYAGAIGALAGQPVSVWAKGLSDDPNDPNSEYKRALDIVSRADPNAVVNGKSGRISMQPNQPTAAPSSGGSPPVVARTPAEAQALPPGTTYTTPDGRTFTR